MCTKCGKKTWIHANRDKIEDGNLYKQYFHAYFVFYQDGYQLRESYDKIKDKHYNELYKKGQILAKNPYYDKIVY